jgi:hypothetical protein
MARYSIEDTTLINIADAIRNKTGSTEPMQVADFAEEIGGISAGGEAALETCAVTITKAYSVRYTGVSETGVPEVYFRQATSGGFDRQETFTLNIVKGTLVYVNYWSSYSSAQASSGINWRSITTVDKLIWILPTASDSETFEVS